MGLAALTKFTSFLFLGATAVALIAAAWLFRRQRISVGEVVGRFFLPSIASFAICGVVIWAGYQFSVDSIRDQSERPYRLVDQLLGESGVLHDLAYLAVESPIYPAPEFLGGIGQMLAHSREPQTTYLLGETRADGGFVLFFPTAFIFKTPIPFILFVVIGSVAMVGKAWRKRDWMHVAPLVCAAAVMLSIMPSGVSIGLRHVLTIFPMLSLVAAVGILSIVRGQIWRRQEVRWFTGALVVWCGLTSAMSHPDYLPYFNAFAGSSPENILADSDLDWGQDVGRLARELRSRDIRQVHLGLFTRAELDHFEWPDSVTALEPNISATGWIAASIYHIKVSGDFAWLEAYDPVDTIGSSIRLYFIPPPGGEEEPSPGALVP